MRLFQKYLKTDKFNFFYIIINTLCLMGVVIIFIKACHINITNFEYSFYSKTQAKKLI